MKSTIFCAICLMVALVVNTNANNQMNHDMQKMMHPSYTM
jgi:hypothetical protein